VQIPQLERDVKRDGVAGKVIAIVLACLVLGGFLFSIGDAFFFKPQRLFGPSDPNDSVLYVNFGIYICILVGGVWAIAQSVRKTSGPGTKPGLHITIGIISLSALLFLLGFFILCLAGCMTFDTSCNYHG